MRPVFIKTFGCKVNYSESISLAGLLRAEGLAPLEMAGAEMPDHSEVERPVVFVNSCCVTLEAERKALQFVRRVKRQRPDSEVLFTGCGARNYATQDKYGAAGARVFAFYTEAFEWLKEQGKDAREGGRPWPPPAARREGDLLASGAQGRAPSQASRSRAFLKVQDGCHNCCSFCIIPFVRPYASLPFEDVLAQARQMLGGGLCEIVLTGVNIGHYGLTPIAAVDEIASQAHFRRSRQYQPIAGHPQLWDLLDALLALLTRHERETGTFVRLRISSIEPEDIAPRFFDAFAHPHMCPHLHLPLQSGSEAVLSAMRRQYTLETYYERAAAFRAAAPQGALTTDIITGHPGETEADFEATLAACTELGFERVHGFPFSPRPGTRSALSAGPRFDASGAQERNRRLLAHAGAVAEQRWSRLLGRTAQVLIESRSGGSWEGYGEAYQQVRLPVEAPGLPEGDLRGVILPLWAESLAAGVFTSRPAAMAPAASG